MKPLGRCAVLVLLLASQGCSYFRDRSNDYQQAAQNPPLQVPQGLDGQFRSLDPLLPIPAQVPDSGIDPNYKVPRPQALASVTSSEFSLQDSGSSRWILALRPPAEVWPLVLSYFSDSGFNLASENAQSGELITGWRELLEQDNEFRLRVSISPGVVRDSSEIFISSSQRPKGSSAQVSFSERSSMNALDGLVLNELLAGLNQAVAQGSSVSLLAAHFDSAAKVSLGEDAQGKPALLLDTDFDRAWVSINRALQNAQVNLTDRDRSQGLYYIDSAKEKKSGLWASLWGSEDKTNPCQLRLSEQSGQVLVTVEQDGNSASADVTQRMLNLIQQHL